VTTAPRLGGAWLTAQGERSLRRRSVRLRGRPAGHDKRSSVSVRLTCKGADDLRYPIIRTLQSVRGRAQGRLKAHPATHNALQKSSGNKNKEVEGTEFKFGQLILRKIILKLLPPDVLF